MFFWRICEPIIALFGILFVFTQILIPAVMNRPLFPYFRSSRKRINQQKEMISELNEIKDEIALENAIDQKIEEISRLEKGASKHGK